MRSGQASGAKGIGGYCLTHLFSADAPRRHRKKHINGDVRRTLRLPPLAPGTASPFGQEVSTGLRLKLIRLVYIIDPVAVTAGLRP